MSYVNWWFGANEIASVEHEITVFNDPGDASDLYLQLYDASIDGTGQYFGLQSTGLVIFSMWGSNSLADVRPGPGAYATTGDEFGPYVSLRRLFPGGLPVGEYRTRMRRGGFDGIGDWFEYHVTFPGALESLIGAVRFRRVNLDKPASFADGGGTWTEFWDNNNPTTLFPVPLWHVGVSVTANGGDVPMGAVSSYSVMPNSDTYVGRADDRVHFVIGGSTRREHVPGWLWRH